MLSDLVTAVIAGAVATLSLQYAFSLGQSGSIVFGAGAGLLILVTFRLNRA